MASFCNPKVFESPAHFRRYYDRPILAGREPGASDREVQLAHERQEEMNKHCNDFILRRTNDILSDHLPPKAWHFQKLLVLFALPCFTADFASAVG